MVDYANPARPQERLGTREREDAVAALGTARDEGRLTPDEFDERAASVRSAVTWGDLAPLFDDLPRSAADGGSPNLTPPPVPPEWTATTPQSSWNASQPGWNAPPPGRHPGHPRGADGWGSGRALGGPWGATIMAFMPFLALGLFFIAGFAWDGWAWAWLFFLLIPITGIVIYGPASEARRGR
ncbi:DUF1707 domain-containing protein [Agromyces sp. LHK192]|uniref:DUF1707 SHOCT-like domain-containing protein n=1 Tax=Agromyces sp. LHK192 TaxID=2498704 RepID=UPI000FD7C208|nr:DUF1707 domain-containing protein [Agromyces sp. LHK192]